MINQIINFHKGLNKGESVKIITALPDYDTHINRTDIIKADGKILQIFKANGAKVAINTDYVVSCCVIVRF